MIEELREQIQKTESNLLPIIAFIVGGFALGVMVTIALI